MDLEIEVDYPLAYLHINLVFVCHSSLRTEAIVSIEREVVDRVGSICSKRPQTID